MNTHKVLCRENSDYLFYIDQNSNNTSKQIEIPSLDQISNTFNSSSNKLNIKVYKMNSFSNYKQPLKNIEKHQKQDYYTLVKSLYQNLKNSISPESNVSNKFSNSDEINFTLNFENMNIIIDHILIWLSYVLGTFSAKNKINAFFENTKLSKTTKNEHIEDVTWKSLNEKYNTVFTYLEQLKSIEIKLNQGIGTITDVSIVLERILLFYLFFDKIFPELLFVKWDLNIPKLNQRYNALTGRKKLYINIANFITDVSSEYHKFFICNFLLKKKLDSRKDLHFTFIQYDCYNIEILNLFHNEIRTKENNNKDTNKQRINPNFILASSIFELSLKFNSLDDLLFQNVLLLLYQSLIIDKKIVKMNINLFPKEAFININQRKILMNYFFNLSNNNSIKAQNVSSEHCEKSYNFKYHDYYNWNNENSSLYISDDAVLDILFTKFQNNLMYLIFILEKNTTVNSINIQANLPCLLKDKQNYIMSLIYFFHNLFKILTNQKDSVNFSTIELDTNIEIPLNVFEANNLIKLDNLKSQTLKLDIKNSSRLIDYYHFPFNYVDYLFISKMNFNDLQIITSAMKNLEHVSLKQLKLEFDYVNTIELNSIKELCKFGLFESIQVFWLTLHNEVPQTICDEFITTIIKAINYCEKTRINFEGECSIFIDVNEIHLYTSSYYRSLISKHLQITSEWNPKLYFYYENFSFEKKGNAIRILLRINKWESNEQITNVVNKLSSDTHFSESNNTMQNKGSILKCLFKPISVINLQFMLQIAED